MSLRAIISDIHGNLEALLAVQEDIRQFDVDEVICLGDIVGYGPNPCECVDVVMDCDIVILGNHDQGALFDPEQFNATAERAIFWTREQLEKSVGSQAEARWEFLGSLPRFHKDDNVLYVHGSARHPLNEYVFPEDIHNQRKMEKIFQLIEQYCFQGHTHVPGIFTEDNKFIKPDDVGMEYKLNGTKSMINVGSVGQPRDWNSKACYVLFDGETVKYRRVEYDIDTTVRKIYDIPDLDKYLGDRLREGR